jgi:hypothetical protein
MLRLVLATGRLLELYVWNRQPVMSAIIFEMVSYATQYIAKALAHARHWQIIETYWSNVMQQYHICPTAFEACTKEILK